MGHHRRDNVFLPQKQYYSNAFTSAFVNNIAPKTNLQWTLTQFHIHSWDLYLLMHFIYCPYGKKLRVEIVKYEMCCTRFTLKGEKRLFCLTILKWWWLFAMNAETGKLFSLLLSLQKIRRNKTGTFFASRVVKAAIVLVFVSIGDCV